MKVAEPPTQALCDDCAEALAHFRDALEERHASDLTIKIYMTGAERFLRFLEHQMGLRVGLDKVSREHAREWLRSLRESHLMPATIRTLYQAARQMIKAAQEDGEVLGDNPFDGLPLPTVEMKEVSLLSLEEIQAMVAAAKRDKTTAGFWGARDQALIAILYDTGIRASEIIGIKPGDIDWQVGRILVHGKSRRERWVGLGALACRALNKYLNKRKRYEIGKRWWQTEGEETSIWLSRRGGLLTTWGLSKALQRRAREASITKKVHTHMFRHSAATVLSSDMSEAELRVHFGWSPTSPQVYRYTRQGLADRAVVSHRRAAPSDRLRL